MSEPIFRCRWHRCCAVIFWLALVAVASGTTLPAPPLRGNLAAHDPGTIIKCKDKYYIFYTGQGIYSKSSSDKIFWTGGPSIFASLPNWTTNAVPGFTGWVWAPDVFYLNGRYCVYYAISTFGSQVSGIGLVTNPTLDPTDASYLWTDQGPVITSTNGSPYNTIDPSVTLDASGNPWMSFGSYWNGIYLVQLDPLTGLRIASNSPTYRLAYNNSIEASCVFRHGGYYYLLADWGSCCSGVNSTYNIRLGRSTSITGPYLDRNGVDMVANGGTLFLQGTGKFTGPGHFAVLSENGTQWFSYHYYDAGQYAPWYNAFGASDFDLEPLSWTADGWPTFTNDWSAVYNFQADARDDNGQYYGLLQNGASIQNDATHGHVLNLNGTNQAVQLPPGVAYARTFSAVVKWNGGGAWQRLFDFGVDTTKYLMLTPYSGEGKLRCEIRANGTTQTLLAPSPLSTGVWTQVAMTTDGSTVILYTNGVAVATNANDNLVPANLNATNNYLGKSQWPADPYFNGQISSVRIFSSVLSPAAIIAPQITIAQPATGSIYHPGDLINFTGGANDFYDAALPASNLTWSVQWRYNGATSNLIAALTSVTNGSFLVPTTGSSSTNGFYRILLAATDGVGRRSTNYTDIFPAAALTVNSNWVSYFPFTSSAQDVSNNFNGTLTGGATIQSDATRGNVLNLSGANQYVSLPAGIGAARTFGGWVKWRGGNMWQRIFDFGLDTQHFFFLSPYTSDTNMQVAITAQASAYTQVIEAPELPTNTWTHVAVTLDGRQGILYLNGQAVAVNNSVNLLPSDLGATKNYFGKSQFAADPYFNGELDSVKINAQTLSPAQMFAPTLTITQPALGTQYAGGLNLAFAGVATDFSDAPLAPAAYSWTGEFHHDGSVDTVLGPLAGVTNGTLAIPTNGPASTNVFYRFYLTATDAAGNAQAASVDVLPRYGTLNLATVPAGLQLSLDGQSFTAPTSVVAVVGMTRSLSAPTPQNLAGSNINFVVWSDGGAATHAVKVPTNTAAFTASFVPPPLLSSNAAGTVALQWPAWAAPFSIWSATNLVPPVVWTKLTGVPATNNGNLLLNVSRSNSSSFYRLQFP